MTHYNDDDIGLRIYQEKVEREIPKDEVRDYNKYTERYIEQGVNSEDSKVLAHFSILAESGLERIEKDEDPWQDSDDMYRMYFFKVNKDGYITELHLHHSEAIFLTILPNMLASLKYLEVIIFPDNLIKEIPKWIVNLKFLRVLDVSNAGPDPHVPDSIRPFIESLDRFNELTGRDIVNYFLKPNDIKRSIYTYYNINYDILIIEDDIPTTRLLNNFFESKGIACTAIVNGTKALEELENYIPKLILTDITHPGLNGYDLCKEIKSNQKLRNIPVFFCTARFGSEVEKHLTETRADGYIHKPFDFSDFDIILDLLRT